jgi:cytochrome c553
MYVHFEAIRDAREAAVMGDLGALRAAATAVRERGDVAGLPEGAGPRLADLRGRARAIEESQSLEEALRLAPVLVVDCGSCHQASGVDLGQRFARRTIPEGEGIDRHAQRLGWSVNRLWEGLLGPSEPAWSVGVDALPDGRSFGPEVIEAVGDRDRVLMDRDRFDGLTARARSAEDWDQRALVLGEILQVCAGCHIR